MKKTIRYILNNLLSFIIILMLVFIYLSIKTEIKKIDTLNRNLSYILNTVDEIQSDVEDLQSNIEDIQSDIEH